MTAVLGIIVLFFLLVLVCSWPLGSYVAAVIEDPDEIRWIRPLRAIERVFSSRLKGFYLLEMSWKEYFFALLTFVSVGFFVLFTLLRWQAIWFFFDPHAVNMPSDTAFNTAISFVTNTNWQSSIPEIELSTYVQMMGITTQQFFSACTGMALLCAFARGLRNKENTKIGNFWRDVVRFSVYVLFPLSLFVSFLLVAAGVPQSASGSVEYQTMEGMETELPMGMVASQVAIKQLGTNGGGLFRANSAHPLENPTPVSNVLELVSILLLPLALCRTFAELVKAPRQGILIVSVMAVLFIGGAFLACYAESSPIPFLPKQERSFFEAEGNMEGKETRFGPFWSVLWSVATTAVSNGSTNSSISSFLPLAGGVPMGMIQLGEVLFGGIGTGIVGAVVYLLLAVFSAGLMVGRTPEYLGKKIEAKEMKLVILLAILPSALVLTSCALTIMQPVGRATLSSHGPHGITETLYAFSSSAANNGSSFQGLQANIPLYNFLLGALMYLGRLFSAALILALAGTLAEKKKVAVGAGTLPTETVSFGVWFGFVTLLVGALNFLPAFTLGPVLEHVMLFFPIHR